MSVNHSYENHNLAQICYKISNQIQLSDDDVNAMKLK